MKTIIQEFISSVHNNLEKKFDYLWPTTLNNFPHENNITLAIAEIGSKMEWFSYAECNMNETGARRDLILINPKEKWICQVEVKFQQSWEKYEEDFWRVSLYEDLRNFIESKSRQSLDSLSEYKKYGLFIAGGKEPLFNLWDDPKEPYEWLKGWFEDFPKGMIIKGTCPGKIENKRFGLAYFLIDVTEQNTVDWINKR
jgi:hypothetical protein